MEEIEIEKARMQIWILRLLAITLVTVMFATVLVMLVGLFFPNNQIDNNEIFKILGPAFFSVSGAVTGSFATMMGMKAKDFDPNAAQTTYTEVKKSDDVFKAEEAKAEASVEIEQIKADAAVEMARLENGYYKPFTYEDGHVDPEAQEGSKAEARWDEDHAQPASDPHWSDRV